MEEFFLDQLKDKDIVCYVYSKGFNCSYEDIAERRGITVSEVAHSIHNVNSIVDTHNDFVSAMQFLFSNEL
jgi:hypothetical protein